MQKISLKLAIVFGLLVLGLTSASTVSAHHNTITQEASCDEYTVKADFSGGDLVVRLVTDVKFWLDGVKEDIESEYRGEDNDGFNIFTRYSNEGHDVKTTGTVKLYTCGSFFDWDNLYNDGGVWKCDDNYRQSNSDDGWDLIDTDTFNLDYSTNRCAKVNICHNTSSGTNPFEAIRVNQSAFDGVGANDHTQHDDFTYDGPVNPINQQPTKPDGDAWCNNNQPGDVCNNIDGRQTAVPANHKVVEGACLPFHLACQDYACVEVMGTIGDGETSCSTVVENSTECGYEAPKHLVCENYACVEVDGEGENECSSIADLSENCGYEPPCEGDECECEGEECEEDPEDPESTPSASLKSSVTHLDPHCGGDFTARMELKDGDSTPEGVTVRFTYRNETKESKTNNEGKAEASFSYSGDENIKIEADGYPSHDAPVRSAQNCSSGNVLGASTEGKILGASTMAATGSFLTSLIGIIGTALTLVSATVYAKKA